MHRGRYASWFLGVAWMLAWTGLSGAKPEVPQPTKPPHNIVASPPSVLPFVEDDYSAARAQAKKSGRLLLVDAWAPWCHTCLSMRNFVFTDARLKPLADKMVYLAIDTERAQNRDFLSRFPVTSWPTIFVLSPTDTGDQLVARFTGALSAKALFAHVSALTSQKESAQPKLAAAERLFTTGNLALAAEAFEAATHETGSTARSLLGLVETLWKLKEYDRCATTYEQHFLRFSHSALATDFASYSAQCIGHLTEADRRQKLRRQLVRDLEQLLADKTEELSVDDRSDGYGTMVELSDALGEKDAGDRWTSVRLSMLEQAAADAKNPAQAATFDAHRFEGYKRLGKWDIAEEMLSASAQAFPRDYNPLARLARLYYQTGRLPQALAHIDRALALCEGPRKASLFELRASILNGQGQTQAALESLENAVSVWVAQQTPSRSASQTESGVSARVKDLQAQIAALKKQFPNLGAQPPSPDIEKTAVQKDPSPKKTKTRRLAKRPSGFK